jgi:predicted cupin superfamily sugar epimerase
MSSRVDYLVKHLELKPHPEGGYFREMYRSEESHLQEHLPHRFTGSRSHCTSIYYLLFGNNFSALHRIKSDEIWHHYEGGTLEIFSINDKGELTIHVLGKDFENNEKPQVVIKAGDWFGSRVKDKDTHALVGCTVAPGFDFEDFEMGDRENLLNSFPQHKKIIQELTH